MALIETRDLTRIYELDGDRVVALDRVSLDIEQSDLVAVMGPSGSGKSTFMNLVGCLDRPTSGTYRLAGTSVETLNALGPFDAIGVAGESRSGCIRGVWQHAKRV